ncbi:MAG: short-chain dehydrogenase [Blastomonas sp. CACIA14H2]|uniref:SDR family oxidoreductase n=1 Tax=Blastomonas sp. CACIA14H2 TaxID=1419876 RepID=UPI0003CFF0EA|nr:MAG: short-chain dehydrogenase [Blastomonas sp. CACIA14H2]
MPTVLITGANRGLGLEFARQYAADGWTVVATARNPQAAEALAATGAEIHAYDALDPQALEGLQAAIGDRAIDVLIANAGILGPQQFDREKWSETFLANVIAPTELALRLKPNVLASDQRKMVALSSILGSIAANDSGGILAYRSSKAALNAAWRSLAIDWKDSGLTLAMIHPGWVQTDMGGPGAQIDPSTSIGGYRKVIARLSVADSGAFLDYQGNRLDW